MINLTNVWNNACIVSCVAFRKAHSTQHTVLRLLQIWQNDLDKSGLVGTALMDLSKV